jgi:hypothetical protein
MVDEGGILNLVHMVKPKSDQPTSARFSSLQKLTLASYHFCSPHVTHRLPPTQHAPTLVVSYNPRSCILHTQHTITCSRSPINTYATVLG